MEVLILGGTRFVGRHLVEAGLERGHRLTLFNRGRSNPGLFPQVEQIIGDRDGGLQGLEGRTWDAVIDTCGYVPRIVAASARLLQGAVEHYVFISTISVYADFHRPGIGENDPVGQLEDQTLEEVTGESYGPLKGLCENAVLDAFPDRSLVVRPGLIVGPHDPTDRFTYWPHRISKGGAVLAPGPPDQPVQFIDGRDLGNWIIQLLEVGNTGIFNATGPEAPISLGDLLETALQVTGSGAQVTWVTPEFLVDEGVEPWRELPLWLPGADHAGLLQVDIHQALTHGLSLRPMAESVRDTLEWAAVRPADHEWQAGLSRDREAALLAAWKAD